MKLSYYLTAALLLVSLAGSGIESKSFIKENKKMQKISEKQKSIDHIVLPVSGQSFDLRLQDISGFKEGLNNIFEQKLVEQYYLDHNGLWSETLTSSWGPRPYELVNVS